MRTPVYVIPEPTIWMQQVRLERLASEGTTTQCPRSCPTLVHVSSMMTTDPRRWWHKLAQTGRLRINMVLQMTLRTETLNMCRRSHNWLLRPHTTISKRQSLKCKLLSTSSPRRRQEETSSPTSCQALTNWQVSARFTCETSSLRGHTTRLYQPAQSWARSTIKWGSTHRFTRREALARSKNSERVSNRDTGPTS